MSQSLVIGLSGQLGQALLPLLANRDGDWFALSRWPQAELPGLRWLHGSLEAMPEQASQVDTLISLGPLDAFASWFSRADTRARRVIAVGSTGRRDKMLSGDPQERALAERLVAAEASLFSAAERRGLGLTVLRPSLLYGGDRDRSLTPLLNRAKRWRVLPLPHNAKGLRQPVHVEDVATAVVACLDSALTEGRSYDLPGGETLPFDEMLGRALQRRAPGCRVIRVPAPLFRVAAQMARLLGHGPAPAGAVSRLHLDQIADSGPAKADFGYAPRGFQP